MLALLVSALWCASDSSASATDSAARARDSVPAAAVAAPTDSVAPVQRAPEPPAGDSAPSAKPAIAPPAPLVAVPPPTAVGPVVFGPQGAEVVLDTSVRATRGPSTWGAVGLSLLLPGSGHRYAGAAGSAPWYHAADLVGWAALFVAWRSGRSALSSAAEIANRYAGASLGSSPDEELLSAMRNFRSRRPVAGRHDSYDESQILSGRSTTYQFADDASHDWDWGATDNPDNNAHLRAFENQYRKWRTSQVALYASAGSLALLRLAATMDVLRIQRSSAARAGIVVEGTPTPDGVRGCLSWNF